ncbi:glycosyl hydrolase catalytic core-domain-containing protein [Mycena alexandri]|uniref:Glycosyl hydrolase catalytic core-domain-containing protein n=1 Tax=Mycena alexandri TaxID=1745969 RepID=A0AAD6X6E4_9AGAR|nr:glycosyl hydrolase catalytic core-domain-containing protein [Mycena alexandri]
MTFTTLFLLFLAHASLAHPTSHPTSRAVSVNSSSKAGIAGGGDADTDMQQFTTSGKVSWYYEWSVSSDVSNTDLEFVPMLWGQKDVAQWTDASDGINATISQHKPTAVLGFNEPQETGQSNLTPQQGADLWKTYIEPLHAQGLRLGSPAPSSAPSGKTWIQDFLTACAGACTVDFIALHYYDVNATKFIDYLTDFHNTFQRPIWVTEWACQNFNNGPQCTASEVAEFLNTTQSFMDAQDWVERYAWYGVMRDLGGVNPLDAMMSSDGKINDLGQQYIGTEAPKTSGAPGATGTAGLPGIPTSNGILKWSTSWGLIWIPLTAFLL